MECFRVPGLGLDWSIQTKSGVLVSPTGVLSKDHIRHTDAGRQGRLDQKAFGEIISGTSPCCDSAGCYLGHVLI